MEKHLDTCENQFGFKGNHGTDMCIFTLKNVINYYKMHGSAIYACFLDASKAFDRVNHWTLFKHMIDRKVPKLIIRILIYWYREQEMCVKWGGSTSSSFKVSNGVRQGGILSPRLFSIYMDELSKLLCHTKIGCTIGDARYNHLLYADDLCLLAPSPGALQQLLNVCNKYGLSHDIVYNPNKSHCVVFRPRGYKLNVPTAFLGNIALSYKDSVKYLGVVITDDCNDNQEIKRQTGLLYGRANTVLRKFYACSVPVKMSLLQTFCMNFYCSPLWRSVSKHTFNRIKAAYNNVYRSLLGFGKMCSASGMLVNHNITTFDAILRKNMYDFKMRLQSAPNELVCTLSNNSCVKNGAMLRNWMSSLYNQQ